MRVGGIAEARGQHPVEAFLDVSLEANLKNTWRVSAVLNNIENLKQVANGPYVVPGVSDGGAHTKYLCSGDYTTDFLTWLVREHEGMSLEDAHWRLAKYPAQAAGLVDRGSIAVGMPADIIVYDLPNLKLLPEQVSYDFPGGEWRRTRRAEGYEYT